MAKRNPVPTVGLEGHSFTEIIEVSCHILCTIGESVVLFGKNRVLKLYKR